MGVLPRSGNPGSSSWESNIFHVHQEHYSDNILMYLDLFLESDTEIMNIASLLKVVLYFRKF